MSADNFVVIRNHPNGGYTWVMGHMSASDEQIQEKYHGEVSAERPQFDSLEDVHEELRDWIIEYGISDMSIHYVWVLTTVSNRPDRKVEVYESFDTMLKKEFGFDPSHYKEAKSQGRLKFDHQGKTYFACRAEVK